MIGLLDGVLNPLDFVEVLIEALPGFFWLLKKGRFPGLRGRRLDVFFERRPASWKPYWNVETDRFEVEVWAGHYYLIIGLVNDTI